MAWIYHIYTGRDNKANEKERTSYHCCRRQGQNAEAADLIEALFERPSM